MNIEKIQIALSVMESSARNIVERVCKFGNVSRKMSTKDLEDIRQMAKNIEAWAEYLLGED